MIEIYEVIVFMKKKEVDILSSPGFKKILFDFCKAKQTIYNYSPEVFNKKVENFFVNIDKITFITKDNPLRIFVGNYKPKKKEVVLKFNPSGEFNSEQMQIIAHELNHAWNDGPKRRGIFLFPIKALKEKIKNPLDFKIVDEVINEAETQILLSQGLKSKAKNSDKKDGQFHGYAQHEPIFEVLCILCNQNGVEFLRDIEGKNIFGIISHISNKMKIPEDEVNIKFQKVVALISKLHVNIARYNAKNARIAFKSFLKKEEECEFANIEDYVTEFPQIYEILKDAIEKSGYSEEDKKRIMLKFQAAHERHAAKIVGDEEDKEKLIYYLQYDKNNPDTKFDFGKIESDDLISSGEYDFVFKEEKETFLKRILRGLKSKNIALPESNNDTKNSVDMIQRMQEAFNEKYCVRTTSSIPTSQISHKIPRVKDRKKGDR